MKVKQQLFKVREATQILGITKDTLREMRTTGQIEARRVGSRWMYSRAELERIIGSPIPDQEERAA